MKYADVIAKLSLREKCALLSGATVFETHALIYEMNLQDI